MRAWPCSCHLANGDVQLAPAYTLCQWCACPACSSRRCGWVGEAAALCTREEQVPSTGTLRLPHPLLLLAKLGPSITKQENKCITVLQTQTKQTVLPGCPPSCARLPSCSGLAWYAVHEFLAPLPRSLLATLVVPSSHACPRGHDMSHPSPPLHTCDASNPSTAGRPRILRSEARVWGGPISWSPRGRTKRWPSGTVP